MVNKATVGKEGPAFEMAVERGKVREFARATKSAHRRYLDDEFPPVPPTFLTTAAFWQPAEAGALWREIDLDGRRLLDGGKEYVFPAGPPKAGAALSVQTRVESIYEKEGKRGGTMTFVVTVTDFHDERGNLVAQARSTAIETARPPA